jgi:hypothetical protein
MFLDQVNVGDMDLIGYHTCFEVEGYPNCSVHNCGFEGSEGFENDLASLAAQVRAATGAELARLAADNGRVSINMARHAIQIVGCNDEIVLSINLSPAQKDALRAFAL